MILQSLHAYYHRRQADADTSKHLPAFGLERKEIDFILEVDASGILKGVTDVRRVVGTRKLGTAYLVPKGVKKTSGIAANLLWDNSEYVLAIPDVKKLEIARTKGNESDYLARLKSMQSEFIAGIERLAGGDETDDGVRGTLAFLKSNPAEQSARFAAHADIVNSNAVLTFRLLGDTELVSQRAKVAPQVIAAAGPDELEAAEKIEPVASDGWCLVTGQHAPIERLHTAIKGVWGAQTSGANIISFNLDAFNSYSKAQGSNAPVSRAAAFAYTTALNSLLARESSQRIQVADASTVFWAQTPDPMEEWLSQIMGGDDNPDAHTQQVKSLLEAVHSGAFSGERGFNKFFVLGLAPNAARISIRFWQAAPLQETATRVVEWFDDLAIAHGPNDPDYPSIFRILTSVALQGKADNIPARLGGDLVQSIFTGAPYPTSLLNSAVMRCRAERQVSYFRAAAIKAYLKRVSRRASDSQDNYPATENLQMLDTKNPSPAYRMGRLFATLEKIQEEASPGLNATIRDRYYGAASSTPVAVFTTLMRLKNHHLRKIGSHGRVVNLERLLAEILSGVADFPVHLNLPDQGRFAIGYYHQRQEFFTKREASVVENLPINETAEGGN